MSLFQKPTRGQPVSFERNGQTLTVEWNHYPAEPANDVSETVEVVGVYDLHNDGLAYAPELYVEAEKAVYASKNVG